MSFHTRLLKERWEVMKCWILSNWYKECLLSTMVYTISNEQFGHLSKIFEASIYIYMWCSLFEVMSQDLNQSCILNHSSLILYREDKSCLLTSRNNINRPLETNHPLQPTVNHQHTSLIKPKFFKIWSFSKFIVFWTFGLNF